MEMSHDEIVARLREIHERATELAGCGAPAVEQRAAEMMAISWALLWSEAPFEAPPTLLEHE